MLTDKQKKSRDRANRSKRALLKEQKDFGFISDGSGKRYRIPVDYVVSGDVRKAEEFIRWFEDQFSDDVGEPVFLLYSAITCFRLQETYRELDDERDIATRRRILNEWRQFRTNIRANEI